MYFQASDYKKRIFLNLNNDNNQSIHPIYSKGSTWLKHFGLSNSLCAHITRLITKHAPIGEYRLRFSSALHLHTHVAILLLRQEHTYYMGVNDIWSHGILSKNPSKMFLYFSSLIWMYSASKKVLYRFSCIFYMNF